MVNTRNTRILSLSRILTRRGFALLALLIAAFSLTSTVLADAIYQTQSMPGGKSWADSAYWSGAVPSTSTANDYYVGQGVTGSSIVFRTKENANNNSSDTFPTGNTLWMGYNTDGTFSSAQGQIGLKSWNFTIDNMQLGNSLINQAMKAGTINLKGSMSVNGTVEFQFGGATDRFINVQSAISGAGEITLVHNANKDNLIISSANNAFTGTLNVAENSGVNLTGANAMQNATSIVLNSGSSLKLSASEKFVQNAITGSGTLKIAADQTRTSGENPLEGLSNAFTGTINVTNTARAYYSQPLSENVKLVIDDGAQLIAFPYNDVEINCDISLSGYGKKIQSANAGGLVFQGLSKATLLTGKITLGANSMIGAYAYVLNAQLAGDIETNGHILEFRQTRNASDTATFTILGDVLSSGDSLGRIQFAHDSAADNNMTTYLRIGDATAADESSPTVQALNVNLVNKNKNEIIFQPGANRTVTVAGKLSNDSSGGNTKGYIKEGEGTLVLNGRLSTQLTVNGGVVEFTELSVDKITGKITVNANGTLEYNIADGQKKTMTVSAQKALFGTGDVKKTGDGTLKINAAQGAVDVQKFVVDSGRLDMKEYLYGQLEVMSGATFSPGNSIGTLEIGKGTYDGGFILNDGATLLMEIGTDAAGEVVSDQLIVNGNIVFGENAIIQLALDENSSLAPNTSFTVDLISGTGVSEDTLAAVSNALSSGYFTDINLTLTNGGVIQLSATLDANAVPEPSTWALMVLGVAGLMYWRKRNS